MRAVALSFLGRFAEARTLREGFGDIGSDKDETNQHFLVFFLASAILSEDTKTTGELLPRLAPLAETLSAAGVSIGRLLGGGAKLLGQPEDARGYYNQALEVCTKIGFRPETALIRLGLAELLLDRYSDERADAIEHLPSLPAPRIVSAQNPVQLGPRLCKLLTAIIR